MKIRRDYSQPFFRQPKRHRLRNLLIVCALGMLLGLTLWWQGEALLNMALNLSLSPPTATPSPNERALRAARLMQAGDFAAAEPLLAKAVAERPAHIGYLYEYGRVLLELGRAEEAAALGDAIIDIDARDARGFSLKAAGLTWAGQAAEAIPIALAGLEAAPGFTPLYAVLSRAYIDEQRWTDGLEASERGLSLDADDADVMRAYAYALQSVGAYEDAVSYLQRALELRPSYLPLHFELAGLYLARNENQSAIDLYDRILALDARNSRALLRLCLAYRKVGEFSRALGFCEDAAAEDPSDAEAQFQLGLLYYRERQFERSRDAFDACVTVDAGLYDLSCRYRLALSYYYLGDCTLGWSLLRDSLEVARALDADSVTVSNILQGLSDIEGDPQCLEEASAITFQD